MAKFKYYKRKQITEMRPYEPGEIMDGISVSDVDRLNGSPMKGDFIARNPSNHADKWLVSAKFVEDNYVEIDPGAINT